MNRKISLFCCLAVISFMIFTSCAPKGTSFTSVWKDPQYQGGKVNKVMVIGVSKKPEIRKMFEDEFVNQLQAMGADGVASYTVLAADKMLEKDAILEQLHSANADACLITQLIAREDAIKQETPGDDNLTSQYPRSYNYSYNRGYILEDDAVSLKTNLYDTGSEKLIWSALSETFKRGSDDEVIKTLIEQITKNLSKKELL
jgi:hypothetical protein